MEYPPHQPPPGAEPPGHGGSGGPRGGPERGGYGPGGPPGQEPPSHGSGYGQSGGYELASNTPLILSIIGIVCWFCCSPASIALGLVAQGQFRRQGQSDTVAKVAWIGGIAFLLLGIVISVISLASGNYQTPRY